MIRGIIFDLDGTLYDTDGMDKANKSAMVRSIALHMHINNDLALSMLEGAIGNFSKAGGRPSIYGIALKLGVPDELIGKMQTDEVRPAEILSPDPDLAQKLADLSKLKRLALVTNTKTDIARKAVKALGISNRTFSIIKGGDELQYPKPSSTDLIAICEELGCRPEDCISVGDRWDVDLAPAKEIGMATKKVRGRDNLYFWICELIRES